LTSVHFKYWLIFLQVLNFALPSEGQFHFAPQFKSQNKSVASRLETFSRLSHLEGSTWGLQVQDAATGQILASHQARTNLIPASNMKLFTSLNGLATLGENFRFKTRFLSDGPVSGSVLQGNLTVEGGGDPTIYSPDREKFGQNFFQKLTKALKEKGISSIQGKIIVKDVEHAYKGLRSDWSWSDVGNYYGAGIYPININENQFHVYIQAGTEGSPGKLKKKDSLMDVRLEDVQLKTDKPGSPDLAYFYWIPGSDKAELVGSLPADQDLQKVKGALQHPDQIFLQVAQKVLKEAGISIQGEQMAGKEVQSLFVLESPPLSEILKEVNLNSNNLMTESVAYALALNDSKKDENGWTQLEAFARKLGCAKGYYFADGSGLSPTNRISPQALCTALAWAKKQPFYPALEASLPVSGISGTMKNYCKGATGKIRAKSGTLTRTFCYSGYAQAKGRTLIFSVMINNYSGPFKEMKKELEKVLESFAEIK
jgi:D-alanyl-D-alanine carboxypeptidase/D-alanyl-D-alanine-endopeptidase (penicillin-binding protein 4)